MILGIQGAFNTKAGFVFPTHEDFKLIQWKDRREYLGKPDAFIQSNILGRNKIQILQTKRENNWFPTALEIEETILRDKNKNYLLFLNSPNNPSGQICENLKEIAPHASPNKIMTRYYDEILNLNNRLFGSLAYFDPEPIDESRVVEFKF